MSQWDISGALKIKKETERMLKKFCNDFYYHYDLHFNKNYTNMPSIRNSVLLSSAVCIIQNIRCVKISFVKVSWKIKNGSKV